MNWTLRAACAAGAFCASLAAQSGASPEQLSAWPFFKEYSAHAGLNAFALDGQVLDKARPDQADIRLYDTKGQEIPYLLRVRRQVDTHSLFNSRIFNHAVEAGASLVSCDLGEQPQEHNEAVITTSGNNFRRAVEVQGSADGAQWAILTQQGLIFRFAAEGRSVDQESVTYPVSRFRYLRIRVDRDPQVDRGAPEITGIAVRRSVQEKGETSKFSTVLEGRDAEPMQGRPASVWRIDVQNRIPLDGLSIEAAQRTFSRPFQLESVDDPASPVALASGELTRTEEYAARPVQIAFPERFARHLKLTITDDRNPPLSLTTVTALSAARQVFFPWGARPPSTIRVYYGNPKAIAPHYDIAATIPAASENIPVQMLTDQERPNPTFQPEPKPFSERSPWLVYLVLGGACAALAALLLTLAKTSMRQARTT